MKITAVPELPQASSSIPSIPAANHSNQYRSPELPQPTVTAPEVKDTPLSQEYANMAKKERALRSKIQAEKEVLQRERDALAAEKAEIEKNYIQRSRIPELFQRDSTQALRELGLSGDTLTQALLNQPSPHDLMIQDMKAEIQALKSELGQTKNMFGERDNAAMQQALTQILTDTKNLISSNPENYEAIKTYGLEEEVVSRIKEEFEKSNILKSVEEVADALENELVELYSKGALLKKVQTKLQPPASSPAAKQAPQVRTLANSQITSAQTPMSSRERAILAFEGKLS